MKKQFLLTLVLLSLVITLKATVALDTLDTAVRIDTSFSICEGQQSEIGGHYQTGTYIDTSSVNGQCTIWTVELTVIPLQEITLDPICVEEFDFPTPPSSGGVFSYIDKDENGCDVIVTQIAYLKPDDIFNYITPCIGEQYLMPDGTLVDSDTTIIIEKFHGICSYNEYFTFEFLRFPGHVTERSICANDTIVWNGMEFTEPGMYTHTATDLAGCEIIEELVLVLDSAENCTGTVSVEDSFVPELRIYPNPANNFLTITTEDYTIDTGLEILDVNGQLLEKTTMQNSKKTLDISDLESGVYFLKIIDNKYQIQTKSFIKL